MATVAAQLPTATPTTFAAVADNKVKQRDVDTVLNYHKPNEDGSPPHPTYVDRPETYERPVEPHTVHITDISGRESEFKCFLQVNAPREPFLRRNGGRTENGSFHALTEKSAEGTFIASGGGAEEAARQTV